MKQKTLILSLFIILKFLLQYFLLILIMNCTGNDDGQLNTYNLLFSKPQYGLAAPISATNMITANPYMKVNPDRNIHISAGINFM